NGNAHWVQNGPGGATYSVIITANADAARSDRQLNGIRRSVLAIGGSIQRKFNSINGLAAKVPAARLRELANRADVFRISPNRLVARAASLLEQETGADGVRGGMGSIGGLDGSGVGIAILDSGIMSTHASMLGANGATRVKAAVDFTAPTATLDTPVAPTSSFRDPYGHGTLVASIAAGRDVSGLSNSTGIAPGASLVDVRVLDANGTGDVATTIAGIDW